MTDTFWKPGPVRKLEAVPDPTHQLISPSDRETERALLGAILIHPKLLGRVTLDIGVNINSFYHRPHAVIFAAMTHLEQQGTAIDTLTVRRACQAKGVTPIDAGLIEELPGMVPSVAHGLSYAERVVDLAEWRAVMHAGLDLVQSSQYQDVALRERAEGQLAGRQTDQSVSSEGDELADLVADHLDGKRVISCHPTPWAKLNVILEGGLRAGETTLVGGWSNRAKSPLIDQILFELGISGRKVHLWINEMTRTRRAQRLMALMTGVDVSKLINRVTMTKEDHAQFVRHYRPLPFGITDCAGWSAAQIARDIRRRKPEVAGVDILHLIPHKDTQDLDEISSTLTIAARQANTHLLATVHLNDERNKGACPPAPVLRDIRGSAMFRNNADQVMFIHRPEEEIKGTWVMTDQAQIYVAKSRHGEPGGIVTRFDGQHMRFTEVRS